MISGTSLPLPLFYERHFPHGNLGKATRNLNTCTPGAVIVDKASLVFGWRNLQLEHIKRIDRCVTTTPRSGLQATCCILGQGRGVLPVFCISIHFNMKMDAPTVVTGFTHFAQDSISVDRITRRYTDGVHVKISYNEVSIPFHIGVFHNHPSTNGVAARCFVIPINTKHDTVTTGAETCVASKSTPSKICTKMCFAPPI